LEAEKRPVRGKQDSQKHRYLACRRPEFEKIREKAHKLQLHEVDKIRRNVSTGESHILRFASNIFRSAWKFPVDPDHLWLGTWNNNTLWRVCIRSDNSSAVNEGINPDELMKLRKIVKVLTVLLVNAVRALWAARGAILHLSSPSMSRLLIPTRCCQGSSTRTAPKQNHSIDENTVVTEPPTIRSKCKKLRPSSED
jgi:hypothetical protein